VSKCLQSLIDDMGDEFFHLIERTPQENEEKLNDIYDGYIWKRYVKPQFERGKNIVSSMLSFDGATVKQKKVWPFILCIAELPRHLRYCLEYLLLPIYYVGNKDPPVSFILTEFLFPEFQNNSISTSVIDFDLIAILGDLEATALLHGIIPTGYYGCDKCKTSGQYSKEHDSILYKTDAHTNSNRESHYNPLIDKDMKEITPIETLHALYEHLLKHILHQLTSTETTNIKEAINESHIPSIFHRLNFDLSHVKGIEIAIIFHLFIDELIENSPEEKKEGYT
jgi:hypothetical protein